MKYVYEVDSQTFGSMLRYIRLKKKLLTSGPRNIALVEIQGAELLDNIRRDR